MFFKALKNFRSGRALEPLVAGAPELRPLHSLLELAGVLGFFSFGAAFFLTLARGLNAAARRFF